MTVAAVVLFAVLAVMLGSCAIKFSVWRECRATNSFFYCAHLIGN